MIEANDKAREELMAFLREWGIDGNKVCADDWDLDGYYELAEYDAPYFSDSRYVPDFRSWRNWPEGFPRRKFYRLTLRVPGRP